VMAELKQPQKVLAIIGLIFVDESLISDAIKGLKDIGGILIESSIIPFTHTTYYNKEMGNNLLRQWLVFERLIMPDMLVPMKLKTVRIEKEYLNEQGGRKINIDPGLLSLNNLILASTKNYAHRLYLGQGIYGELTLIYKSGKFQPLAWTYPDYREPTAIDFFTKAREFLKKEIIKRSDDV